MKEAPMIDAFDTADFNPELILSSVFLDHGLDFVTNIDDLGDNIIASDLLQQLGSSVFYTESPIATNVNGGGSVGLCTTTTQHHAQNQLPPQQQQQQQQQHHQQQILSQPSPALLSAKARMTIEKPTDEMRYDTFGSDYAKPQLVPAVPLPMPMVQQIQQQQQQQQQTAPVATQQQQPCKCEFCEYLQANRISLTGDHSFQCEFCGEGFSNQTSFNRHRCGSTDIQIYRCENCRQEYGSSRAVSSIGNCEPRDKCDICNRNIVQSLPEEQAAYGPAMVAGSSSISSQTTPASMSDVTIDGTVSLLVTSPEVSNESVSDLSVNVHVRSIVNSPIEQHDLSSIDPFGSDSECLGQFFTTEASSTSPCTANTTNNIQCTPMPTSANIGSLLPATTLNHPESAKTYFVLGNVEQLQQFHAAAAAAAASSATAQQQQPTNNLPTLPNSFHPLHLPPPGPGAHQQQQQQLPLSLQHTVPVTTASHLPSEHEVTSLQQYDQYDDEDYSSMSEDEAIVPIEPYAKSPNQDHAKTELPIQETIVDTSTGISTVIPLPPFGSGGLPRDDASLSRALLVAHVGGQHLQLQQQSQQQQHHHLHSSSVSQLKPHLDDDEEGKCDSSSPSLGIFINRSSGVSENGVEKGSQKAQSSLATGSNVDRPYKCHICERSYRNQKNLKSHLKVHEGIRAYQCEICGKNFSGSSYLVIHRRRHTGERPFKCVTCGKAFVDSRALAVHARLHSGERLKCEKCEKTFSSVSALTVHNRLHTGIHPYKCELCGKTFPQYNNLKHHMKKHEQPNGAENQSQVSATNSPCAPAMSNGVSTTSGSGTVSGRLRSPPETKLHGAAHMVASSTTGSPFEYKCHICSKLYKSADDLQEHLSQHGKDRPNQCEFCSKVFPRSSHLIIHRRRHTGERPFKCKYCDKAFVDSRALSVHTRLHTGERVKCEICEKTFASSSGLIVHRRIHTGVHPYKCDYCDKSFAQSTALKYHLKKHDTALLPTTTTPESVDSRLSTRPQHGTADLGQCSAYGDDPPVDGNDRYKCTVCSKVFRSSEYLVRHRRTHSGERPYQCEICGKNFSTMSYLVIHRRRHTSERPYKCTSCEKAFVDSRALQEHARLHTGDRVRCEICQKTYSSVSNLIVHRRIHSGIHPFECDSCGKSFAQKNALKYHLKKHSKQDQTEPIG
ncbi:zinc finger protein 160-like isoform X2 [Anopheles funestus]|uniref:zinc finger protein 160-like isoform X2 n=1 Tax=Anopheles funestus TaxID=62324 RepID=UPI0020C5B696|nr:zinc finger protein 160-like isoform X2 [Anopheles funestus]